MHRLICAVALVAGCAAAQPTPSERLRYEPPSLANVRAAGEQPDVVGIMEDKARALIRVIRRSAVGSPIRELAVGYLAHSNVYLNVEDARLYAHTALHAEPENREQLLMTPWLYHVHDPDLLASYVAWIPARVTTQDRVVRELAIARMRALGRYGTTEIAAHAKAMLGSVLATPGIDRGIRQTAIEALVDLDMPIAQHIHVDELPLGERYDLWSAVRDGWLPLDPHADATFDTVAAPLFASPIRYTVRTARAIVDAFAIRGTSPAKRAALIARLLGLTERDVTAFDTTGLEGATVIPQGPTALVLLGAWQLAEDPALVDASPDLRAVVARLAAQPFDAADIDRDQVLVVLQPAFVRVLKAMAPATAMPIVDGWQRSIRALAARTDGSTYYATYASVGYLLALAELAPQLQLVDRVRALTLEIAGSPLPSDLNRNMHPILTRGALIANRML